MNTAAFSFTGVFGLFVRRGNLRRWSGGNIFGPQCGFWAGSRDRLLRSGRFARRVMVGLGAMACAAHAAQTWVVDSASDPSEPGKLTLRAAITAAADGDTIEFASSLFTGSAPTAISLSRAGGALVVGKSLTVIGPAAAPGTQAARLQLRGSASDRILQIKSPAVVVFAGIALQGGEAMGGGAVLIEAGASATFQGCDFANNEATGQNSGGAILNRGTVMLDQCLVTQNRAGDGGGIASFGRLTVNRSLIEGNVASRSGGGIYVNAADLSVESATISGNTAGTGGGIAFVASVQTPGAATFTAVTVVDNNSAAQAGGLYVEGAGAAAAVGGSIFARNMIVNSSGAPVPHDLATQKSGKITSADYNIVVKPGTTLSPYGKNDQIGVDPQLGALAFNGGRTRTYAIGLGSPALDRGNPLFPGALSTDQRGVSRIWPVGGRVDVGAFEFAAEVSCVGSVVVECVGAATPATVTASLMLPRGGTASVTWSVGGVPGVPSTVFVPDDGLPQPLSFSGSFAYGTTAVTVSVISGPLNLSCSSTVTVRDTTPPVITVLGANPYYVEFGSTFSDPGATALDGVSGSVSVSAASTVDVSRIGIYSITYEAVDAAGNRASASRTVNVRDTVAPVIDPLTNLVAEATSAAGAVVTFTATATDTVGTPTVTTSPVSGSTFPLGISTVLVTARDASGNTATRTFTVTVRDTTPPVITGQPNLTVEATSAAGAVVVFAPTATDLVSTTTVTTSPGSGSTFALGTTTVLITARDVAGNTATSTFNVTVRDTTAPRIAVQANLTVIATIPAGAIVTFTPTATDAVSTPTVTTSPVSGSTFAVGTTTVTITARDAAGNEAAPVTFTVTVTDPYGITLTNVAWPLALNLALTQTSSNGWVGSFRQMIARAGEARWYKFNGRPGSLINVTLSNLSANFDVLVYTDIRQAYEQLLGLIGSNSSGADKLTALLGAEFAPEIYMPEIYMPEIYMPEIYMPEIYMPEIYMPEIYMPEIYMPEAYMPEIYMPEIYMPEGYASAQQRSLIAFSASDGTASERIRFSSYSETGDFYIRVRGQNGVYSTESPYDLNVTIQQDLCGGVTNANTVPSTGAPALAGAPTSLLVWDSSRISGTAPEKAALAAALASFATAASGVVVDVNTDAQIRALNQQADANPYCPYAKNLVADAIRNLIQRYRTAAPTIADVTLVGNDDVIPFFRSNDGALLASEANYFPPVQNPTQSQSALRSAQVLSQDRYGSSSQVTLATGPYDLPGIPVGRVVETAPEVTAYLDTYRTLFNGTSGSGVVPTLNSAFVAGYEFLADSAEAMRAEFSAGLGAGATVDSLISPVGQPPALGWTADQLRAAFLGSRHDISYLAGHFSTAGALAADYTTRFRAREVADSTLNLAFALVISAGCHSGYGTVDEHAIPLLTEVPDWAQAFARKKALWIGGTGYQYGDTDFIEYTERLLLELARALRTGTGPVSIGRALVEAKRRYLSDTAVMRGIHEKTLLQLTLYGLPMVKLNFPGARLSPLPPVGDVLVVTPVTSGPGTVHTLKRGELVVTPVLTRVDRILDLVGATGTISTSYFRGSDGFVSIPGEPVRPLESFHVSRPEGLVRGVGFRGGQYQDLAGFVPFTGAPTTETPGVHARFSTEVFFPVRPWNLNQVGELTQTGGTSELNVFPTQFLSDGPESDTGTLRKYGGMQFTVFYCPGLDAAALANPPALNVVASTVGPNGVAFAIEAAATAGAGVQEVWVTYTGLPGSAFYGTWRSLTLNAPANATGIGTWTGLLPLNGADPTGIRFIVQAVNGIGAVSQSTNYGRYFSAGTSTLDGVNVVGAVTSLAWEGSVPSSGHYLSSQTFNAKLTNGSGLPLAGKRVHFRLGPVFKSVLTNASGIASGTLTLSTQPGAYTVEASYAGDAAYQNSSVARPFTVTKMPSTVTLESAAFVSGADHIIAKLRANDGTRLRERTVLFILELGSTRTAKPEITDGEGQARLTGPTLVAGTYQVSVYFGQPVTLPDGSILPLSDPLYGGATTSRSITVATPLRFGDTQAWLNYADPTVPGASATNLGLTKADVFGVLAGSDGSFGPNSILASARATRVTAYLFAQLSGQTIAVGSVPLRIQANDNMHWRGDAVLNGTAVELNVDWDGGGTGTGKYHVWINPSPGSGPLYNAVPALLNYELILGTGNGEKPAGGAAEIGGADKPWTQQTGSSRVRSN